MIIGHDRVGTGARGVIVMNDWRADTSTWDGARAYLDLARFTYAFADLRGYGRSLTIPGAFNVEEAAHDMLELANALGWKRFALVGHSMSSLVALHLAQQHADCVERAVVITPPPPAGFGADETRLASLRAIAHADDEARVEALRAADDRLSVQWTAFKAARWRATSTPDAVAAYAMMFARDGMPQPTVKIDVPVLAVTGEQDFEIMRRAAVTKLLAPLCTNLAVESIAESGHYPMQETPPLVVTIVERFLGASA